MPNRLVRPWASTMGGAIGSSLGVVGVGGERRSGRAAAGDEPLLVPAAPLVETGQRAGLDVGDQRPGELQLRPEQRHLVLALDGEQAGEPALGGDVLGRLHLVEADLDRPQRRRSSVTASSGNAREERERGLVLGELLDRDRQQLGQPVVHLGAAGVGDLVDARRAPASRKVSTARTSPCRSSDSTTYSEP